MSIEDDFSEALRRGLEAAAKKYRREVDDIPLYDMEQKPMRPYATYDTRMKLWTTVADARPRDHDKPRPLTDEDMRGVLAKFKTGKGAPINVRFGLRPACDCGGVFCPYVGRGPMLTLTMDIVDPISGTKTDATNSVLVPAPARADVKTFRSWVIMRVKWLWLHECNEFLFYEDRLATDPHPEQPWYKTDRERKENAGTISMTMVVDEPTKMRLLSSVEFKRTFQGVYVPPDEDLRPVDRNGKRTPGYVDRLPRATHKDKFGGKRR